VVDPTNGTAILDDGSIRYTPDAGFAGDDAFSYVFTDADGLNAGALATVTVRPGNRPPVALPDTVTVPAGTVLDLDVLANDTDPDGDAIRVFAAGDPPNGTAEIIDGGRAIRYTPDPGFTGDDVFAYLIVDARGARSNEVEVTITVQ
ncbi:MAG: Ig-like domain-containing protein, partial [Rhodothermales bacterium]|nr:Ig-like domain-containing protein [Rhodothermales bacterium]